MTYQDKLREILEQYDISPFVLTFAVISFIVGVILWIVL